MESPDFVKKKLAFSMKSGDLAVKTIIFMRNLYIAASRMGFLFLRRLRFGAANGFRDAAIGRLGVEEAGRGVGREWRDTKKARQYLIWRAFLLTRDSCDSYRRSISFSNSSTAVLSWVSSPFTTVSGELATLMSGSSCGFSR